MTRDRYFKVAVEAAKALVKDRGENATFPFDAVWSYAKEEVPGPNKPHQAGRLVEAGYLELTGGSTRAESPARAGSPTREYRPGAKLRSTPQKTGPPSASVADAFKGLEKAMAGQGFVITAGELANFLSRLARQPTGDHDGNVRHGKKQAAAIVRRVHRRFVRADPREAAVGR